MCCLLGAKGHFCYFEAGGQAEKLLKLNKWEWEVESLVAGHEARTGTFSHILGMRPGRYHLSALKG